MILDNVLSLPDELIEEGRPGDYSAAIERGKELELDEVVAELIGSGGPR